MGTATSSTDWDIEAGGQLLELFHGCAPFRINNITRTPNDERLLPPMRAFYLHGVSSRHNKDRFY